MSEKLETYIQMRERHLAECRQMEERGPVPDIALEVVRGWAELDIRYWFAAHEKCPNCGVVLRDMHPMANLYPHWTGACRGAKSFVPDGMNIKREQ